LLLLVLLWAPVNLTHAQRFFVADYAINWHTVDGGGGLSRGGGYSLQGAIGQPDVGSLQGGDFALAGGYWSALQEWWSQYLPVIFRTP